AGVAYTVTALPQISNISPLAGNVGAAVTITGTGFTGAQNVKFNGTAQTVLTVNAAGTQITTTVPAGATDGPLTVTTSAGTSPNSAQTFDVNPIPANITFTPQTGAVGTQVVISGNYFTGATAVKFNGVSDTSFVINSDTQITAHVPATATSGFVTVQTPNGTGTSAASFSVIAGPTITGFNPPSGPIGTAVAINGSGFTGATEVDFGGVPDTTFVVASDILINAHVPTGAVSGPITVTAPGGVVQSGTPFSVNVVSTAQPFLAPVNPPILPKQRVTITDPTNPASTITFNGGVAQPPMDQMNWNSAIPGGYEQAAGRIQDSQRQQNPNFFRYGSKISITFPNNDPLDHGVQVWEGELL